MDKLLEKQLQSYVPPEIMQSLITNKVKYDIAKYVVDKDFKHKPQKWKTVAFPEYEDFFQAAFVGFNPYKTSESRDKGVLQAIESYNPYKKHEDEEDTLYFKDVGGVIQAVCPMCSSRGELVSLWPHSAGNITTTEELAPEPVFFGNNKYCGKIVTGTDEQIQEWERNNLIRRASKSYYCNYSNRLASLKNHISNQLKFLVQDIRNQEYHPSRSLKKHPHYTCAKCHTQVPDFNTSSIKTTELECTKCSNKFSIAGVKEKVWKSRGTSGFVSLQDSYGDDDSKGTMEDVITVHDPRLPSVDPAIVYSGSLEEKSSSLIEELIDRIRLLAASCVGQKQYARLLEDPETPKDKHGVPETLNFQIFYNYFFMDDPAEKLNHTGRAKNNGDETSTYRELALRFLKKEQHYTECNTCKHKMYEPTESAKFKKAGTRPNCEVCIQQTGLHAVPNVTYHGPKCGHPDSLNPNCKDHGDVEIVMYIFQTIEPKVRRLEKLIQEDPVAQNLYDQIEELYKAREQLGAYAELARILNY